MEQATPTDFTQLLERYQSGEKNLQDQLLTAVYSELRRLASRYMSNERSSHTLQPTALVHEAWLRFASGEAAAKNRSHFLALAAGVMKDVLIDHARRKLAAKRGGPKEMVSFDDSVDLQCEGPAEMIELADCIEKLKQLDERQGRLIEFRVFGGMSFEEAAEALDISLATAKRDWLIARAWLYRELT